MNPLAVPRRVFPHDVEAALDAATNRVAGLLGEIERVAIGWATVDLERAATALDQPVRGAPDDELLGARCVIAEGSGRDPSLVLLEPITEGRLAAALARHGEGPIALYATVAPRVLEWLRVVGPASGVHPSRPARGPLGRCVLILDGPPSGPHLVVAADPSRGTIEP